MVVCIILFILGICFKIFGKGEFFEGFSSSLVAISVFILLTSYLDRNNPTALDVYQNKTELQITYNDSVPIDTVVIYKEPQEFDWWTLKNK